MKIAALDLGTNSFLCLIVEIKNENNQIKIQNIISDQVEIVRLGQGVQANKKFHPDALERARKCLTNFRETINFHKPDKVLAMATSAARDVSNSEELFKIGRDLKIPIEIIPGEKEAEITFFGSISGMMPEKNSLAVIDVGGGSTEIILGDSSDIYFSKSANIGAVRITEMFFPQQPPTCDQYERARDYISQQLAFLQNLRKRQMPKKAIAVAGTPTEIARLIIGHFDASKIDGMVLGLDVLEEWRNNFLETTSQQRQEKYSVSPGRADVILAGTMILIESLRALGLQEMVVSTRGVRFGVALEIAKRSLLES